MEKAKACYSLSSIKECQKRVRQFSWSTRYKGEHYSRCIRVRDLYVYCQYELKSFLFDPDYSPARDYIDMLNADSCTKKELDQQLCLCRYYLEDQLDMILRAIDRHEVDANP